MLNLEAPRAATAAPGARRRPPPLTPMRLGRFAQAGLIGLRVLLGVSTAMAAFAAFRGPHG
jgi:hypothetical protein